MFFPEKTEKSLEFAEKRPMFWGELAEHTPTVTPTNLDLPRALSSLAASLNYSECMVTYGAHNED
jgi:hypothetical protein